MNIVILAGGGGTRLWPMSRANKPKQFWPLVSELTLLEETYNRFKKDFHLKNIYIAATKNTVGLAKKLLPETPATNYIIEPEKRDTGPAMAFAAAYLSIKANPNEPMAFIASDHFIKDPDQLVQCLKESEKIINETGKMIDIAITPTFPNINLGYTKIGKKYKEINGIKFYNFEGQKEKPDLATAKKFVRSKNYLWHANFFMWTPKLLLEAYKKYAPEIYNPIEKVISAMKKKDNNTIEKEFSKTEKLSIDYAVAERMDPEDVLIIKGEFGWSDIGSWNMLYDQLIDETDSQNNLVKANSVQCESNNCLVYGQPNKIIAIAGLNDIAIIDTEDALLVCKKDQSHLVKKIVGILKQERREKYL